MERVSVIKGRKPILLVCPHGADDDFTAELTEQCAHLLDAYAVINRGFERTTGDVDVIKDKADCNRVDHCIDDIVYEEYLHYILKYRKEIQSNNNRAYIYHIHGFGKQVKNSAGQDVDIILGYGLGGNVKDSLTCRTTRINHFVASYKAHSKGTHPVFTTRAVLGKGGGKYAARSSNNMNQYFRQHESDLFVESIQIEISQKIRAKNWSDMGIVLAVVLDDISIKEDYSGLIVHDEV